MRLQFICSQSEKKTGEANKSVSREKNLELNYSAWTTSRKLLISLNAIQFQFLHFFRRNVNYERKIIPSVRRLFLPDLPIQSEYVHSWKKNSTLKSSYGHVDCSFDKHAEKFLLKVPKKYKKKIRCLTQRQNFAIHSDLSIEIKDLEKIKSPEK